eukprot:3767999-Prymnesium_polylepis.1
MQRALTSWASCRKQLASGSTNASKAVDAVTEMLAVREGRCEVMCAQSCARTQMAEGHHSASSNVARLWRAVLVVVGVRLHDWEGVEPVVEARSDLAARAATDTPQLERPLPWCRAHQVAKLHVQLRLVPCAGSFVVSGSSGGRDGDGARRATCRLAHNERAKKKRVACVAWRPAGSAPA